MLKSCGVPTFSEMKRIYHHQYSFIQSPHLLPSIFIIFCPSGPIFLPFSGESIYVTFIQSTYPYSVPFFVLITYFSSSHVFQSLLVIDSVSPSPPLYLSLFLRPLSFSL